MVSNQNIWNLLVTSGLVRSDQIAEIRTQCEGDLGTGGQQQAADRVLKWLLDQKRISGYQSQVLAEGQPGPFQFEHYRIHAIHTGGPLDGSYRARHVSTNHPVRLWFFGGSGPVDAQHWQNIRQHSSRLSRIESPFVCQCYEVVEEGEYRFVVFEDQPGKPLSEKLPYKGRLPWPQTLQAIELLALGLAETHRAGLAHGRLWPGSIWLLRGGICQLMWQIPYLNYDADQPPELAKVPLAFQAPAARKRKSSQPDFAVMQREDLFSLGALAFRMISGKEPKIRSVEEATRHAEIDKHLAYCEKYELPENVARLIRLLLAADLTDELKDASVSAKLAGAILESQSIKSDLEKPPETLAAYTEILHQKRRSKGFLNTLESIDQGTITDVPNPIRDAEPDFTALAASPSSVSTSERLAKRRGQKNNRLPLILGGSILAVAMLTGLALSGLMSPKAARQADKGADKIPAVDDEPEKDADAVGQPDVPQPVAFRPQNIVEDNRELPWESPTGAEPINLDLTPAAPEILLALRPHRMLENENASRFLQSLGTGWQSVQDAFVELTGTSPDQMERVVISLHTGTGGTFDAVAVVELIEPVTQDDLWQRMNKPDISEDPESGLTTFALNGWTVYFEMNETDQISRFGCGPTSMLQENLGSMGLVVAGRTMTRLVERSDRDRDVTLIFRNSILLSEEAKWLFAGRFAALRRPLSLFFDDRMEGIKLSLHFDQGSYLEWMSYQNPDMDDDELLEWLPEKLSSVRNDLTDFVSRIPPHPYWASVQQRFDNMINELVRQVRIGKEREGLVANCWLPEPAPHNLFTAGELVLNGSGFSGEAVPVKTGPTTLQQLLDTKRDLVVASDPDLINLLLEIEQEVNDDFPDLPFRFRIALSGNDLAVEGITQNQRPGNFEAKQTPLGEILAQVMFRANPDKSASGPADPNCKLVWVIAPHPDDPATEAILVTTRKAATDNNLKLPELFQPNADLP